METESSSAPAALPPPPQQPGGWGPQQDNGAQQGWGQPVTGQPHGMGPAPGIGPPGLGAPPGIGPPGLGAPPGIGPPGAGQPGMPPPPPTPRSQWTVEDAKRGVWEVPGSEGLLYTKLDDRFTCIPCNECKGGGFDLMHKEAWEAHISGRTHKNVCGDNR